MKLRTQYVLAYLSGTILTFGVVGAAMYGFVGLKKTTDYLVNVNSVVLEQASLFEKNMASSRRSEKEFFIFPDNPSKQAKYISGWEKQYKDVRKNIAELSKVFEATNNSEQLDQMKKASQLMTENEALMILVVKKFQETKDYEAVSAAEYNDFKNKAFSLEEIGKKVTDYGIAEVSKGREALTTLQEKIKHWIYIIAGIAILWGVTLPFIIAQRLTSFITKLTEASNAVSMGVLDREIETDRADELGDLARAFKRMQASYRILMSRVQVAAEEE